MPAGGRRNHEDEGFAQRLHLTAQIVQDAGGRQPGLHPLLDGFKVTKTTPELAHW